MAVLLLVRSSTVLLAQVRAVRPGDMHAYPSSCESAVVHYHPSSFLPFAVTTLAAAVAAVHTGRHIDCSLAAWQAISGVGLDVDALGRKNPQRRMNLKSDLPAMLWAERADCGRSERW